jgi:hypothetical protein
MFTAFIWRFICDLSLEEALLIKAFFAFEMTSMGGVEGFFFCKFEDPYPSSIPRIFYQNDAG